jgi:hypothetical protein
MAQAERLHFISAIRALQTTFRTKGRKIYSFRGYQVMMLRTSAKQQLNDWVTNSAIIVAVEYVAEFIMQECLKVIYNEF